jgi:hypothetical protein
MTKRISNGTSCSQNREPSDWWKNAPPQRKNRKRQATKLKLGQDETGDWDVVKGGRVSTSEFGYLLDAGSGEALAVMELEEPIENSARLGFCFMSC